VAQVQMRFEPVIACRLQRGFTTFTAAGNRPKNYQIIHQLFG